MIYRTRGIVFRTIKFSESSVVSKIYTEKFGMQSYIVNGVRTAKSKTKASLLQAMSLLEMEVYHHEHRNLNRIKEMQQDHSFTSLLFDPLKSSVGLFIMEVLNKCIHEEEPNLQLFTFIRSKLLELDERQKIPADFLLRFLLELAEWIGFLPYGEFNDDNSFFDLMEGKFIPALTLHPHVIHPPLSEYFSRIISGKDISGVTDSGKIRRELLDVLLEYYRLHVPRFSMPKSLHVLDEVFK